MSVDQSSEPTLFDSVEEPPASVTPDPPRTEAERLDPDPLDMVLKSGLEFEIEALRLRQFLRLMRIVTKGAADMLDATELNFDDAQEFVQVFLGLVLFSIPQAEEETVDFLRSMVRPKDLTGDPESDLVKTRALSAELYNPDLEDTVLIIQRIIEHEAEDLRALGKRLGAMLKVAQKMGATNPSTPIPTAL